MLNAKQPDRSLPYWHIESPLGNAHDKKLKFQPTAQDISSSPLWDCPDSQTKYQQPILHIEPAKALQIALRPKIIVCLGRVSACSLIDPKFKVTRQHGTFFERNGILMMGTFHPAALLRNPVNKPDSLEDFLKLREKIDELGIPV